MWRSSRPASLPSRKKARVSRSVREPVSPGLSTSSVNRSAESCSRELGAGATAGRTGGSDGGVGGWPSNAQTATAASVTETAAIPMVPVVRDMRSSDLIGQLIDGRWVYQTGITERARDVHAHTAFLFIAHAGSALPDPVQQPRPTRLTTRMRQTRPRSAATLG